MITRYFQKNREAVYLTLAALVAAVGCLFLFIDVQLSFRGGVSGFSSGASTSGPVIAGKAAFSMPSVSEVAAKKPRILALIKKTSLSPAEKKEITADLIGPRVTVYGFTPEQSARIVYLLNKN